MDAYKFLIMIRDKETNNFLDQTNQVVWYREDDNAIRVKFKGSDKFYYKSYSDMRIFDKPSEIEVEENMYFNGHKIDDIKRIIYFDKYYKVFFENGNSLTYQEKEVSIIKNKNDIKDQWVLRFNYFKELAKLNVIKSDFLNSQYNYLNIDKSTILFKYLNKSKVRRRIHEKEHIYPFGLNLSQKQAVENAFSRNISFIEGPPGTGKTNTILNIIANAVYINKSIAVVSNNNSAIENIKEKLNEYNYDFLTALLGNKENKQAFFDDEINKDKPLDFLSERTNKQSISNLQIKAQEYRTKLPELFEMENKLADIENLITKLETEYSYYNDENKLDDDVSFKKVLKRIKTSDNALYLKTVLNHIDELNFIEKLKLRLFYRIKIKDINESNISNIINIMTHKYYELKIKEMIKEKQNLNKILEKEDFSSAKGNYQSISNDLFKNYLFNKYDSLISKEYSYEKYRYNFDNFIEEYPVILSTSYALIPSAEKGFVFDYLVIDEASQTDLLSSMLALSCAKNIVIVGDTKQLPHIENNRLRERNKELMKLYNIPECYNYLEHNILTSSLKVFPSAPKVLLKEHYRCHPKIINFCNEKYYNNELVILTKNDDNKKPLYLRKTVEGNHARKNPDGSGLYNQREIDEIKDLTYALNESSIGVITPFRIQADKMRVELKNINSNIEVDTVHKFQGRAKDIVILSTVANNIKGQTDENEKGDFISRDDLLNVAVSRAKKELHLVVSDGIYNSSNNAISDLIQYMEYHSGYSVIEEGKVRSIYDLLYEAQKDALRTFRKKHNKTMFDSENLTLHLIEEVLSNNKLNNLKVTMHVTLDNLITRYDDLNEKEKKYVTHPWTHVDFLIFNQLTKKPILVIEVDGVYYHEQNDKQKSHDDIKDKVLSLNNIPILRLKTNESKEKDRIMINIRNSLSKI